MKEKKDSENLKLNSAYLMGEVVMVGSLGTAMVIFFVVTLAELRAKI